MTSPGKSKALAIAPKFTAFLSICGSLGIVLKVLFNKSHRKKTMHRIVMGMSVCDIIASIWYFTSTWAIPAGTLSWFGDGETERIFWAAGDQNGISCSFAGFFNQFAVATPLYNCTLAVFYLLVVNYGWKDSRIGKIEWLFHAIPVGYALITSIFAVAADLYGHVEWTCWILPGEFFDETQELTPIQSKFQIIQWLFLFGVVWACIIVVTIIFVILYFKMKSLERVMSRYSYSSTTSGEMRSSISAFSVQHKIQSGSSKEEEESQSMECAPKSGASEEGQKSQSAECAPNSDIEKGNDANNEVVIEEEPKGSDPLSNVKEEEQKGPINAAETTPIESSVTPLQKNEGTRRANRLSWIIIASSQRNAMNPSNRDEGNTNPRQVRREVSKSKKIAVQGLLYVGVFYVTWLFPTISRITELIAKKNYFPIQFLDTTLLPLQGFFNFAIYIRPRYLTYRRQNKDDGFWKALKTVVFEIKID
jgi:hypothetical protein